MMREDLAVAKLYHSSNALLLFSEGTKWVKIKDRVLHLRRRMPVIPSAVLFRSLVERTTGRSLLEPRLVLAFCVVDKHVNRMIINTVTVGNV